MRACAHTRTQPPRAHEPECACALTRRMPTRLSRTGGVSVSPALVRDNASLRDLRLKFDALKMERHIRACTRSRSHARAHTHTHARARRYRMYCHVMGAVLEDLPMGAPPHSLTQRGGPGPCLRCESVLRCAASPCGFDVCNAAHAIALQHRPTQQPTMQHGATAHASVAVRRSVAHCAAGRVGAMNLVYVLRSVLECADKKPCVHCTARFCTADHGAQHNRSARLRGARCNTLLRGAADTGGCATSSRRRARCCCCCRSSRRPRCSGADAARLCFAAAPGHHSVGLGLF